MISLSQKTVEEFFQNSNWQGIKLVEAPRKNEASDGQESFFQPHLSLIGED